MRQLFFIFFLSVALVSCSKDDTESVYTLELRVESQGDFRVWWNYTGNPDADADWLTQPPILHNLEFVRTATIERGDFYTLRIEPVDATEYSVKILIDGNIVEEQTTSDYTFIDRSFFP